MVELFINRIKLNRENIDNSIYPFNIKVYKDFGNNPYEMQNVLFEE